MYVITRNLMVFLLLVSLPGLGHALGLGKIKTTSALNEPFEGKIELISASRDELDSLKVILADLEAFRRAGIERSYVLTQLKFGLSESDSGPDYIRVYSREPIREPFLNFLLEVSWSKGRIFREYTVLLDPPIYAPIEERQIRVQPEAPSYGTIEREDDVVYEPTYQAQPSTPVITSRQIDYTGGDYGPTVTGDTLWSLARAMRPDSSISIQQMMFALLRANPDAFIDGNINGLKRGEILKMPDLADIQSLSKEEAFQRTMVQNNAWDPARFPLTEDVPVRPEVIAEQPAEIIEPEVAPAEEPEQPVTEPAVDIEVAEPEVEGEPELRLVAPDEGMAGDETTTDAAAGDADSEALEGELALANESIEALKLENADLGDKLSEAEGLITDLQRYIELKENELNLLQEQVRIAAVEQEQAAMPAEQVEEMAQEEVEEAAAEEGMMEEEMTEEEAAVEEEVMEEAAVEDEAAVEEEATDVVAASSMVDTILTQVTGVVGILKNNSILVAAGLGVLVLVAFGATYAKRRRESAEFVDIPAADDFEDMGAIEGSEDETDIGTDMADAEAATVVPHAASEEPEPDFDISGAAADDATQVVAPPAEEEEEDPMAEVNVFLAYEHFDQAEDFVKKAIDNEPDNLDFHSKLLEVYYAAGNKKGYEEAARVLNEKVNGKGDHWDMAVAMWQELSPNRAMFEAPSGDEEEQTLSGSGGIVDITGDEDQSSDSGGEMLDVTAAMNLDEEDIEEQADDGGLDFTPASEADTLTGNSGDLGVDDDEVLDITSSEDESALEGSSDEDMLDVTAAVGLDEEEEPEADAEADDGSLDFSFGEEAADESAAEAEQAAEAISEDGGLDFSFGEEEAPAEASADDDMLDLTMDAGEAEDSGEADNGLSLSDSSGDDVLDLTMDAGEAEDSGEADNGLSLSDSSGDDVLDLTMDAGEAEDSGEADNGLSLSDSSGDDVLDLTADSDNSDEAAGLLDEDVLDVSKSKADDLLDVTTSANFEPESAEEDLLDVTAASSPDSMTSGGNVLLDTENKDDDEAESEFELDIDTSSDKGEAGSEEGLDFDIGLDVSSPPTGEIPVEGLDLDLLGDGEEKSGSADELSLDMDNTMEIPGSALKDVKMEEQEPAPASEEPEIDMESTVQAPSFSLSLEDDDDGGDKTVLVKRSSEGPEQSAEDEIGTQLDLAKAYIELGDTDNAKTILDEVIAQGNDDQKQQAQELLGQI